VRAVAVRPQPVVEKPANGGLCNSAGGLQTPNSQSRRQKMPKVSGHSLNNSRFRETSAGDRVRSALGGPACSVIRHILGRRRRQIGNAEWALPRRACSGISQILRLSRRLIGIAGRALAARRPQSISVNCFD
jgi:hypothetical protein